MWLAARPEVYFTTDHFNGYTRRSSLRIPSLAEIDADELFELVSDAWLACAPKRLAKQWLGDQGLSVTRSDSWIVLRNGRQLTSHSTPSSTNGQVMGDIDGTVHVIR